MLFPGVNSPGGDDQHRLRQLLALSAPEFPQKLHSCDRVQRRYSRYHFDEVEAATRFEHHIRLEWEILAEYFVQVADIEDFRTGRQVKRIQDELDDVGGAVCQSHMYLFKVICI